MSTSLSSIILGVAHVLATFLATVIVDRAGRKILLLISSVIMTTCLIALGIYFYLSDSDSTTVRNLGWLPLTSLSVYILSFAIGFGPIPWVIVSEVFSNDIKAFAGSVTGSTNWILAFIVTNTYGILSSSIGTGETFWMFAVLSAVGFIFVFLIVPETRGKTLSEIQDLLSSN